MEEGSLGVKPRALFCSGDLRSQVWTLRRRGGLSEVGIETSAAHTPGWPYSTWSWC